jgi:hypothetical protein
MKLDNFETISVDVVEEAEKRAETSNPFISLSDLESICEGDEALEYFFREVVSYSLKYTETVCRFKQIRLKGQQSNESGEREEIERIRSTIHDSTIDAINALSRGLKKAGKDNQWISKIAQSNRAGYGKAAILWAFEFARNSKPKNEIA